MTSDENRSPANLLLLCIEHSYEVDERPDLFPAEMLREWKRAQLEEYERVQRAWPLSDVDVGRVLEASSKSAERVHADAVMGTVRAVERLSLTAREGRRGSSGGRGDLEGDPPGRAGLLRWLGSGRELRLRRAIPNRD